MGSSSSSLRYKGVNKMSLASKIKNRAAWAIRKTKKYSNLIYQRFFGVEEKDAQTNVLPDSIYLKKLYKARMGKELDLKHPKTFNEKLQWLKLYDRKPIYTTMVDKYEVKDYVARLIGEEYIIPTLGVWDRFDDIDFDSLPERFVLKCTHDSGGVYICKDKTMLNIDYLSGFFKERMSKNYYKHGREWPYKNVKPRIIAEQYMEDTETRELRDYKFYCFDGFCKALLLASNRQSESEKLCFDYYDTSFKHLHLTNHWHPNAKKQLSKPKQFDLMIDLATKLSKGIPHIRIDLFEANGHVYFGEFTFFDMGGFLKIHPDNWDSEWGELIKLPCDKKSW